MIFYDSATAQRFGTQLCEARLSQGWSKQDIAFAAQIPVELLRKIERGSKVDVGFVADVARVLGIVLTILPFRSTPFFTVECNSLEVNP
jgi:transcriptional regulator with XRE-family HTH domain